MNDSVIAGALFDFMGWLTSRKERIVLSSADEASPAVDAIENFAKMRGLSLDNAQVQTWQEALAQPVQVPVAWANEIIKNLHALYDSEMIKENDSGDALIRLDAAIAAVEEAEESHKAPPQRPWVGLTDEEMQDLWDRYAHMEMMRAIEAKLKEKNT